MRTARSALVLCMVTSLGVAGYGLVWGFHLLAEAAHYRQQTGDGLMFIGLLAPMSVVLAGLLVAVLFAIVLAFTGLPAEGSVASSSLPDEPAVDESELDRKWARYTELAG